LSPRSWRAADERVRSKVVNSDRVRFAIDNGPPSILPTATFPRAFAQQLGGARKS
jgi:hypothetical protein